LVSLKYKGIKMDEKKIFVVQPFKVIIIRIITLYNISSMYIYIPVSQGK
jgi:hypothetical protein